VLRWIDNHLVILEVRFDWHGGLWVLGGQLSPRKNK
jgi:hypothetical protein